MAEIHVERKPTRKIWPLILGLLVAALVIWGLVAMMNNRDETDAAQLQQSSLAPVSFAAPASNPVTDRVDFARAA
jgi:hypothetical protein